MDFTLFTEKSTAECIKALSERLEAKATRTRPALDGYAEKKGGRFALTLSQPVVGPIQRSTRLEGHIAREHGLTVIRGSVPDGAPPRARWIVVGALLAAAVIALVAAQIIVTAVLIPAALGVYVLLKGDYENGDRLLVEVERALKANPIPPKKYRAKFGYE